MDTLWLILVLSAVLAIELLVGRWLGNSEFERQMRRMTRQMRKMKEAIGQRLLPSITMAIEAFKDFDHALHQFPLEDDS